MNDFLERLSDHLLVAAGPGKEAAERPRLSAELAGELLDLARVAAHTSERRMAPLATYLAGYTAAAAGLDDPAEIAKLVASVRAFITDSEPPG